MLHEMRDQWDFQSKQFSNLNYLERESQKDSLDLALLILYFIKIWEADADLKQLSFIKQH